MTNKDTTLLNKNIKLSIAVILSGFTFTATFVWKGAQYTATIVNTVQAGTADISQLKSENKVLNYRVGKLEKKVAVLQVQNKITPEYE